MTQNTKLNFGENALAQVNKKVGIVEDCYDTVGIQWGGLIHIVYL